MALTRRAIRGGGSGSSDGPSTKRTEPVRSEKGAQCLSPDEIMRRLNRLAPHLDKIQEMASRPIASASDELSHLGFRLNKKGELTWMGLVTSILDMVTGQETYGKMHPTRNRFVGFTARPRGNVVITAKQSLGSGAKEEPDPDETDPDPDEKTL